MFWSESFIRNSIPDVKLYIPLFIVRPYILSFLPVKFCSFVDIILIREYDIRFSVPSPRHFTDEIDSVSSHSDRKSPVICFVDFSRNLLFISKVKGLSNFRV